MIVVADNLRITLPAVGRAVERLDPAPIRQMVNACMHAGAQAIDINSGPLSRAPEEKMTFLVRTVLETVDLPIVLDTAYPRAMAAGLAAGNQKSVINGVSLEPERLERIPPLARQYNCDVIGYLAGPDGHVPADAPGRMEAAVGLFNKLQIAGIPPERIISILSWLRWPGRMAIARTWPCWK